MFNLFNKSPKVREGKQKTENEKTVAGVTPNAAKQTPRFAALQNAFAKFNKMDRKQAYTWGGVALVVFIGLLVLGSAMGSGSEEDFTEFETRGYDLANMPFSSDEAEQYLLASKYPEMKDKAAPGLYSKAEKELRQAEDAAEQEESALGKTVEANSYVPGHYTGGGGGSVSPTQVKDLGSADLKGAKGAGTSSTFGPTGDFSNFRTQEKGSDKFVPQAGKGDARMALFQTAKASRAAAGLKNDKLLNTKKAMMGGHVKGSDAFMDDSGAVNLGATGGLELDTNAPIESADLSGLDEGLKKARDKAKDKAEQKDEDKWWKDMLAKVVEIAAQKVLSLAADAAEDAIRSGMAERNAKAAAHAENLAEAKAQYKAQTMDATDYTKMSNEQLAGMGLTRGKNAQGQPNTTGAIYRAKANGDPGEELVGKDGTFNKDNVTRDDKRITKREARKYSEEAYRNWSANPKNESKYQQHLAKEARAAADARERYFNKGSSTSSSSSGGGNGKQPVIILLEPTGENPVPGDKNNPPASAAAQQGKQEDVVVIGNN